MTDSDKLSLAYKYAPYPILAVIFVFMYRVRTSGFDQVVNEDVVYFGGNDPWYHARMIHLMTENFPNSPNFDPWTHFPFGTGRHSGFGGLFDQMIAFAAIITSGGDPSPHHIDVVAALAPAVFGALTVIPTYFIVKKIAGRWSGIFASVALSLFSGTFLFRTVVGSTDHSAAEIFFVPLTILAIIYAVEVIYAEKPTMAHLKDRDWHGLRKPVLASVAAGFALALYLMIWPQGVMLFSTLGLFVLIQTIRDHYQDRSTEYLAFGMVVMLLTTTVFTLLYAKSYDLSQASYSLLQPFAALMVIAGTLFLHYVSSYLREEDYDPIYFPGTVAGTAATGLVGMFLLFPRGIELIAQLIERVYSYGYMTSRTAGTVAEIIPPQTKPEVLGFELPVALPTTFGGSPSEPLNSFGILYYVSLLGFCLIAWRLYKKKAKPAEVMVLVWSFTMLSAYMTMIRFHYYYAVNAAVLSGYVVWWIADKFELSDLADTKDPRSLKEIKGYQVITIFLIIFLMIPGNIWAVSAMDITVKASEGGERSAAPTYASLAWHNETTWMNENTPDIPMDYDKFITDAPDDMDFDYPEGAYGVMSWWDYGHWITSQGERLPFANPFQEGPRPASAYLQEKNETRANLILESIPSLQDRLDEISEMSNEELREVIESQDEQEAGEDINYVLIDDQMVVVQKFSPITQWTGPDYPHYISSQDFTFPQGGGQGQQGQGQQTVSLPAYNENFEDTMISTLYFDDASGLEHYRLIRETETYTLIGVRAAQTQRGLRGSAQYQRINFGHYTDPVLNQTYSQQRVYSGGGGTYFYDLRTVATVKGFERVKGATINGQIPSENVTENTSAMALVSLQTTNTNRSFTYTQTVDVKDNGEFEITVPYHTKGDVSVEDGGTNASIRPRGNYTVLAGENIQLLRFRGQVQPLGQINYLGSVGVPEEAIYDGDDITVELERRQTEQNQSVNNTGGNGGNGGDGSGGGNGDDGSGSDNGSLMKEMSRQTAKAK